MIRAVCLASVPFLFAAPALAQEMQPGMWEITSTVTSIEMPGAPPEMAAAMAGQVTTLSQCVTAEQLANGPEAMFAQSDGQCEFSEFSMQGGQVKLVGACAAPGGQGQMTMATTGTYTATTYETEGTVEMAMPGGGMKIQAAGAGRRTGDC